MSTTIYPSGIDSDSTLPQAVDLVTPVKAEVVNMLRDAIIAIESELGVDPSREFGTVRARLDFLQDNYESCSESGIDGIIIKDEGSTIVDTATKINFIGDAVTAVDAGDGQADVTISFNLRVVQESILVSDDQTVLFLSDNPNDATTVQMYINGSKQQYGVDYIASANTISYIGSIPLKSTDDIEFYYIVFGGRAVQETLPVTIIGQTEFVISQTPSNAEAVQLFVNGDKQEYGYDYTVNGKNIVFISSDLLLSTSDVFEAWYVTYAGYGAPSSDGYGAVFQTTDIDGTVVGPVQRATLEIENAVGVDLGSTLDSFKLTLFNQLIQENTTDFTQRPRLRFTGNVSLSDDATPGSEATIVDVTGISGAAGGDLDGTYPDPQVVAITEPTGPTSLAIGSIPDGYVLSRSGSSIVGVNDLSSYAYYQTVKDNGSSQTQRSAINFIAGSNVTVSVSDDSLNDETDVLISADDPVVDGYFVQQAFVGTAGQTLFSLTVEPTAEDSVLMFINSLKIPVTEYSLTGSDVTYSGSYVIQVGDTVEFYYLIGDVGSLALNIQDLRNVLSVGNITDGYDIVLSSADKLTSSVTGSDGDTLLIVGSDGVGASGNGADVNILAGTGGGISSNGGDLVIASGSGFIKSGDIDISAVDSPGTSGEINISSGGFVVTDHTSGDVLSIDSDNVNADFEVNTDGYFGQNLEIAGNLIVNGVIDAPGSGADVVILDIDFSSEPDQDLSANGTFIVGGCTWLATNQVVGSQVINGTGLRLRRPVATSSMFGALFSQFDFSSFATRPRLVAEVAWTWTNGPNTWLAYSTGGLVFGRMDIAPTFPNTVGVYIGDAGPASVTLGSFAPGGYAINRSSTVYIPAENVMRYASLEIRNMVTARAGDLVSGDFPTWEDKTELIGKYTPPIQFVLDPANAGVGFHLNNYTGDLIIERLKLTAAVY